MSDTQSYAVLTLNNNQGYAADQADSRMTLGDLLEKVQDAIYQLGENTVLVTKDTGNRCGAQWGNVSAWDAIELADSDDDDDDDSDY